MTDTTAAPRPAIVPDFGDDAGDDRKIAIICSKGNLDMAYPGLIIANAALGEGVETHLFFTFWGFDMVVRSRMHDLRFSPVANTAMHLPLRDLRLPQAVAPAPGVSAVTTRMMRRQLRDLGIPDVPELLDQIVAAGGHLWGCRMSADMFALDESDLREDLEGIISAADFVAKTAGAQLLFV